MWVCKVCGLSEKYTSGDCKTCAKRRSIEWRNKNLDKAKETDKLKYLKNKDKIKQRSREWEKNNPDKVSESKKAQRMRNPKKFKLKAIRYREANPDKVKAQITAWFSKNLDKRTAYLSSRRSKKLNATPKWLTDFHFDQILNFYTHAKECELLTGDKYHVDHIIPLQGKDVCGLHVPWNLQILPSDVNLKKNNLYESGW